MNRTVDYRTDFYSLGVMLYQMLTGVLPFTSDDPGELVYSHIARAPVPPRERNAAIPEVLSEIVLRLLAKEAEERYQSARGIRSDLEHCLQALTDTGSIAAFPLQQFDQTGSLRIPQKLYGRQVQLQALRSAFDRTSSGPAELILICGYSGVGKSALVKEAHVSAIRQRACFISGKCDQLSRGTPYGALVQALRDLARQLLSEPAERLRRLRANFQERVGANGRLLCELVPELIPIVGEPPELRGLDAREASARFVLALHGLLRILTEDTQLVLFLDDLQWADLAMLRLLQEILSGEHQRLLIIGAYRDNEVDVTHPLTTVVKALRSSGARAEQIDVESLTLVDVSQLVADTLGQTPQQVAELAAVVFERTDGNPFFVNQFLIELADRKLLYFSTEHNRWEWNLHVARQQMATANVADLMVRKLEQLPSATRQLLMLASCIGARFDLVTLAVISNRTLKEVLTDLEPVITAGLVLPSDSDYRYLSEGIIADVALESGARVSCRFLHDRVQQAVYSLIDEGRRGSTHLRIGRLMLENLGTAGAERSEHLFEIVRHLRIGSDLFQTAEDERLLLRLTLAAARRAKAATAYSLAYDYLRSTLSLLGDTRWRDDHALCFELTSEHAEVCYLDGRLDAADHALETLQRYAADHVEHAQSAKLRINVLLAKGNVQEAIRVAVQCLALLGMPIPTDPQAIAAAIGPEQEETFRILGERTPESLVDAPLLTDPVHVALLQLLNALAGPAYIVSPTLFSLAVLKQVNLSLKYGHAPESTFAYATFGFMLATVYQRTEEAFQFGRLALAINDKLRNKSMVCKLHMTFGGYIDLCRSLRSSLEHFDIAHRAGLESGDYVNLSYALYLGVIARIGCGDDLDLLREATDKHLVLMQKTQDPLSTAQLTVSRQAIACLQGRTIGPCSLSTDALTEEQLVEQARAADLPLVLLWYQVVKVQILCLHERYQEAYPLALALFARAREVGLYYMVQNTFFVCLANLALRATASPADRQKLEAEFTPAHAELVAWAERCPSNFQHKRLLIDALRAQIERRHGDALSLFEQAIESAQLERFTQFIALANELCAKHCLERSRDKLARNYMNDAHHWYLRWGADAKAARLRELYPELLGPDAEQKQRDARSVTTSSSLLAGGVLDTSAVLRAAKAITGEIVLDRAIEQLMRIVATSAGAQRGFLILPRDGVLTLKASINGDSGPLAVDLETPLDSATDLAQSVVRYVARTQHTVVLSDAARSIEYAGDPYIRAHRTRSLLCLALTHQTRLVGVLYLENNSAYGAFTEGRTELLQLLSSHAAVAVENALLYAHVQAISDKLRQSNTELVAANERLKDELTERAKAEELRAQLQEEVIRFQQGRLAELSTPLIPITDSIMVMPLIGTMDSQRAEQVLDTALHGTQAHRAQVVIIDITGMKHIDTSVAGTLISTARALRLLGAQAVLTGIRSEIAQTLVRLGIDMNEIVTRANLQTGISYALNRTGRMMK